MLQRIDRPEGHRRLERLRDELLEGDHPTFDMRPWDGCAAGVACRMPEFQAAGLCTIGWLTPAYGPYAGIEAVAAFFEIATSTAVNIFGSEANINPHDPKETALHIDQFLRQAAMAS